MKFSVSSKMESKKVAREDLNVSNLLQTKSHRASKTECTPQLRNQAKTDADSVKWTKAALVGALGSAVMFVIIVAGIASDLAPFNLAPSSAFLERFGLNVEPLPLIVHFGYGILWSLILVASFEEKTTLAKGILMALTLWLIMMVVYSPMMGWGVFGFGAGAQLPSDHPMYLDYGLKYLFATFMLHLIYGFIIGWLNPIWIRFGAANR